MKCLKRDYSWELWTVPLSGAISRLCLLIEEKELLLFPCAAQQLNTDTNNTNTNTNKRYSNDQ